MVRCHFFYLTIKLEENSVHHVGKTCQGQIGIRFSTNCECAGVVKNVCIHDFGTHWTLFGKQPARRTTRVSEWEAAWGTFGYSKFGRSQVVCRQQAIMDCQLRFVEGFWQNKLGCTLAVVIGTWCLGAYGVDFAITALWTNWRSERNLGQQHGFSYQGRCATRMCAQSSPILLRIAMGYEGLACMGRRERMEDRFPWWISTFTWSSVCRWHFEFQWNSWRGRIVARCFHYNAGQDRFEIKRFENSHFDNRGTATRPHHDASWTQHCCKGQFWNTQIVGLHAFSTWLWECWCGHYISFASCRTCFPFKQMDTLG